MNMQTNDIIEDIGDIKNLRNKLMTIGVTTILLAIFASDIKDINFLFIKFKDGHDIFNIKTIGCIVFANVFFLWRYYQKFRLLDFRNDKHMAIEILKDKMEGKAAFAGGDEVTYDNQGLPDFHPIENCSLTSGTKFDFLPDGANLISKGMGDLMDDCFKFKVGITHQHAIDHYGRASKSKETFNPLDEIIELNIEKFSDIGGVENEIVLYFRVKEKYFKRLRLKSKFTDAKYMDYLVPLFVPVIAICMLLVTKIFII